jgi:pyruvate/2-oxoacid:ferredoxin oxidoreductase beta subunit
VAFETTAATAAGVKAGLEIQNNDETNVLAWAGDGGTFDIGFQALSGAAERNDDIIYVCYDNEAYMNTGIQRSSATPFGSWTTTTPASVLKPQPKKNIVEIMAAHRIPYAATATMAYPEDFMSKLKKAKKVRGTRFLHLFASCPTGWRHDPQLSIEVARMAVSSRVFPLYEVFGGERWILSSMPTKTEVDDYLNIQGRFISLSREGRKMFQQHVEYEWTRLEKKCMPSTRVKGN